MISTRFFTALSGVSVIGMAAALTAFTPTQAQACSDSPYIGAVCFMASSYCPSGYIKAEGAILPVAQNQALFALLGNTFGGSSPSTFGVPDLRGRSPIGWGYNGPGVSSTIAWGQKRGAETVTLLANQLPAHSHPATFTPAGGSTLSINIPVGTGVGTSNTATAGQTVYLSGVNLNNQNPDPVTLTGPYSTTAPTTVAVLGGVSTSGAGAGGTVTVGLNAPTGNPVSTLSPQLALTACIAVYGTFPINPNN